MSNLIFQSFNGNIKTEKSFNEYKITLISNKDSIVIKIEDPFHIYFSKFHIDYLRKKKLLMANLTIEEMINFINCLIERNNIEIERNNMNIKLILISFIPLYENVELILNQQEELIKKIVVKIVQENKEYEEEKRDLINNLDKLTKEKILIEKTNVKLNNKIKLIEKENIKLKAKIYENKIKENEEKVKILEKINTNKPKIQLIPCNLTNIYSVQTHNDWINCLSIFPSGKIISVSNDKYINIYDINFNILQYIQNAHDDWIIYVEIIDENNFITCSCDKNIKLWKRNDNEFKMNKIIRNAHNAQINKVIYCSNGNLISCSLDNKIKIWKENNNNNYYNIKILTHSDYVSSLLILENKNILISSGNGTKLWKIYKNKKINHKIKCIKYFKNTHCGWHGGLCKLDDDRIIVKTLKKNSLIVISIIKKEIIKEIIYPFQCYCIKSIEEKGIFLVGGNSNDITIYRNDNYECIQTIKNSHDNYIYGFIKFQQNSIISYSNKIMKIWEFKY